MRKSYRLAALLLALTLALGLCLSAAAEEAPPLLISPAPGGTESAAPAFSDVAADAWYAPYVQALALRGVLHGAPDGGFYPDRAVTRGQVAQALYALSGSTPVNYLMPFSDVDEGQWYAEGVRWAAALGIAVGSPEGRFEPEAPVSRQDLAVLLVRFQQKLELTLPTDGAAPAFADNADIAPYAAEAVYLLQKAGVVSGSPEGAFGPRTAATRAELCKLLSAF